MQYPDYTVYFIVLFLDWQCILLVSCLTEPVSNWCYFVCIVCFIFYISNVAAMLVHDWIRNIWSTVQTSSLSLSIYLTSTSILLITRAFSRPVCQVLQWNMSPEHGHGKTWFLLQCVMVWSIQCVSCCECMLSVYDLCPCHFLYSDHQYSTLYSLWQPPHGQNHCVCCSDFL